MDNVIVVDYSGRGHAIVDLFVRTDPDVTVHYLPGCEAIKQDRVVSQPQLAFDDPAPMVQYAKDVKADLVLVGHPRALAAGYTDRFLEAGFAVISPTERAAMLETSKDYTKRLCAKYGIRTAAHRTFDDADEAIDHIREVGAPIVIKGDTSCQGNGVFVCHTVRDAVAAVERLMVRRDFGPGGDRVVIEEFLDGKELLYFALVGGDNYLLLPSAVDYPRSEDGNRGPMCGGMGAFSPAPYETPVDIARFERQMMRPLMTAIAGEGLDYFGFIYLDCMLVGDQLYLIEINARMGDPEAEVVLPRITSDFGATCTALLDGRVLPLTISDEHFVDVAATQGPTPGYQGWPYGAVGRGYPITGLDTVTPESCRVFYGAARTLPDGTLATDGGKCLHFTGSGATRAEARANAYRGIAGVHFAGIRYRTDIAETMPWD
jgi:phosphoribosylamine--glycine ligase